MAMFFLLVLGIGFFFYHFDRVPEIVLAAVILSGIMNFLAYWKSDSIALSLAHAQPIVREGYPELYQMIEELSAQAKLPMPRIYLIPDLQINAFATGRNSEHAALAITQGALNRLDKEELKGVLAHELSHIGNNDILISSVTVVLAGLVTILADWFLRVSFSRSGRRHDDENHGIVVLVVGMVAAILAPVMALIIQLSISRKREYLADASGVELTHSPQGLSSALEKIAVDQEPLHVASNSMAHLFISNPFKGIQQTSWLTRLFMTHPPIQDRIRALRNMKF